MFSQNSQSQVDSAHPSRVLLSDKMTEQSPSPKGIELPQVNSQANNPSSSHETDNSPSWFQKILPSFKRQSQHKKDAPLKLSNGKHTDFVGRIIVVHNAVANAAHHYPTNYVSTTHYTWWNFLPKNLFEQFRRIANFYFLVTTILTTSPLSPYEPYTSFLPLIFVLGVSAIREALEDHARYKEDRATNSRRTTVFRRGKFHECSWEDLVVGDIVKVTIDTLIPADMLLLSSSDESGLCYIMTANLDGETNLKVKSSISHTQDCTREEDLESLRGDILAEHPSNEIYKFQGQYIVHPTEPGQSSSHTALLPDNLVLRGCELRNTKFIYGLVVYTGNQTRIEMNAAKASHKSSRIESQMNTEIIRILCIQFFLCALSAIIFGIQTKKEESGHWYRSKSDHVAKDAAGSFVTWLLLLSVMLPISLYVTLELVKVMQGKFLEWDNKMYYAPLKKGCMVRSVGLNEDLGQVSHVFSDKTGTLTRNEMVFMRASVAGRIFDHFDANHNIQTTLKDALLQGGPSQDAIHMFLLNLSLCHAVIPEPVSEDGESTSIKYLSPSPDEEALVAAAAVNGFALTSRTANTITINATKLTSGASSSLAVHTTTESSTMNETYEVVKVLDFTSDRKRMSMILRCPDKRLLLLCKGADTEIFRRLRQDTDAAQKSTVTQHLHEFASAGLRTLVLGYAWLTEAQFAEWNEKYEEASLSFQNRDENVEAVNDTMERNLVLVGATAIEDRLQDGVPETLTRLRKAGVRVWVLTGDKQETAINIGHSSGLLIPGMHIFVLNGHSEDELKKADEAAVATLGRAETVDETKLRRAKQNKEHARVCLDKVLGHMGLLEEPKGSGRTDDETPPESPRVSSARSSRASLLKKRGEHGAGYSMVLDSETLKWALDETMLPNLRSKFLQAADLCRSVLLCRCSPLQKAQVVMLVKTSGATAQGLPPVTLAIGDGANDVGMIKAAHIGVGISGKEGMQAVQNSDYAFAQFAYLQRLMLLHGRWNYRRISLLVVYSFYKNIVLVIGQFWFGIQSQFSGQPLYDGFVGNLYNVFFTSGILVTAVLDKDASERVLLSHPELYRSGMLNERFTTRVFWTWWCEGLWDSGIVYLMCVLAMAERVTMENGQMAGMDGIGMLVYSTAVFVVNLRLALANNIWTWLNWFFLFGSVILWYLFGFLYTSDAGLFLTRKIYWVFFHVAEDATFWLTPLIVGIFCNIPAFMKMFIQRQLKPSLKQKLKEMEALGQELPAEREARESTAGAAMLGRNPKTTSMIIDVGDRRENKTGYTGFAMDYDIKNIVTRPFRQVQEVVKIAKLRVSRAMSRRPTSQGAQQNGDKAKTLTENVLVEE